MDTEQHYVSFIDQYTVLTDRLILPATSIRHKPIYICLNCNKPFEDVKTCQEICWVCDNTQFHSGDSL
jgi:hypothetical protein